jgi:hypothetical protein
MKLIFDGGVGGLLNLHKVGQNIFTRAYGITEQKFMKVFRL